jgi:hypothetical protein
MDFQLKANKWKAVGGWFGYPRDIHISVATNQTCRWRKRTVILFGYISSSGSFTNRVTLRLWEQVVQVKSPVDTTCTTTFN